MSVSLAPYADLAAAINLCRVMLHQRGRAYEDAVGNLRECVMELRLRSPSHLWRAVCGHCELWLTLPVWHRHHEPVPPSLLSEAIAQLLPPEESVRAMLSPPPRWAWQDRKDIS